MSGAKRTHGSFGSDLCSAAAYCGRLNRRTKLRHGFFAFNVNQEMKSFLLSETIIYCQYRQEEEDACEAKVDCDRSYGSKFCRLQQQQADGYHDRIRNEAKVNEHDLDDLFDGLTGMNRNGQIQESTDDRGIQIHRHDRHHPHECMKRVGAKNQNGSYHTDQQIQEAVYCTAQNRVEQFFRRFLRDKLEIAHLCVPGNGVAEGTEE